MLAQSHASACHKEFMKNSTAFNSAQVFERSAAHIFVDYLAPTYLCEVSSIYEATRFAGCGTHKNLMKQHRFQLRRGF